MAFANEEKKPVTEEKKFGPDATDAQLVTTINSWIEESKNYHSFLLDRQSVCIQYYKGNQTQMHQVPGFNSNTVHNRIFEGTETLVPIISGTAHQFMAIPGNNNEESLKASQKTQNVLQMKYEELDVRERLENVVRDIILKRFGVIEWFWDFEIDDIGVRAVDPRLMLIPPMRVKPEELPYVIKILEFTDDELRENFPKTSEKKFEGQDRKIETRHGNYSGGRGNTGEHQDEKNLKQVFEVWTPEYVAWKLGDEILERKPNPYWDFEGEEKKEGLLRRKKTRKFFNHLKKPTIPIIFIAPFRTGDKPIGDTSLCEIGIPIQDNINTQKRQIINNLVRMGNGQIYIDKGVMSDELIAQITSEPGLQIVGDGVASENRIRRDPGTQLPNAHFNNLIESNAAFDAIFGVQPSVRGEGEGGTLGGQILNRQQNLTRIELITREVNRGVSHLSSGFAQLMKMFYTDKKVFRMIGPNEAVEFFPFLRDDIEDDISIVVKSGDIFPADEQQRANRAIQLWQLGALSPLDLYKMIGFPNPEETTERLQAWLQGQLVQQTQARIVEGQAGAAAKAQATPDRGVETNTNSIDRAENSIGGGPTKLPNAPK